MYLRTKLDNYTNKGEREFLKNNYPLFLSKAKNVSTDVPTATLQFYYSKLQSRGVGCTNNNVTKRFLSLRD